MQSNVNSTVPPTPSLNTGDAASLTLRPALVRHLRQLIQLQFVVPATSNRAVIMPLVEDVTAYYYLLACELEAQQFSFEEECILVDVCRSWLVTTPDEAVLLHAEVADYLVCEGIEITDSMKSLIERLRGLSPIASMAVVRAAQRAARLLRANEKGRDVMESCRTALDAAELLPRRDLSERSGYLTTMRRGGAPSCLLENSL